MDSRYLIIAGMVLIAGIIGLQGPIMQLKDALKFGRVHPAAWRLVRSLQRFQLASLCSIGLSIYASFFFHFRDEEWVVAIVWVICAAGLVGAAKQQLEEIYGESSRSVREPRGTQEVEEKASEQTKEQHALPAINEGLVAQAKCQHCGCSEFYTERKSILFGRWVVDGGSLLGLFGGLGLSGIIILLCVHNNVKLLIPTLVAEIFGFTCIVVASIIINAVWFSPRKRFRRCTQCHQIFQLRDPLTREDPT